MTWPPRGRLILVVCAVAIFQTVTAITALHVAVPTLAEAFDADTRALQWIVDVYAIAFGGLLLTGGTVGDRLGRRTTMAAGFVATIGASLVAMTATSIAVLIGARLAAGAAAAVLLPASLAVLTDTFEGPSRARAIAIWSGIAGGGGAAGPALGGWVLDLAGWEAIFAVSALLSALGLVGAFTVVPAGRPQAAEDGTAAPIDRWGVVWSMTAIAATLFTVIEAPALGLDPLVVGAAALAVVATVLFVRHEGRTDHPMLPLEVFAWPRVRIGAVTLLLAAIGFNGVVFVASLMLQDGWGYSATATGMLLLPIGAVELVVSMGAVPVADRLGLTRTVRLGLALMAAGYLLMAGAGDGGWPVFLAGAAVAGVGNGFAIPLSVERIVGGDDARFAGVRASISQTSIELGASGGVAILGAVQRLAAERDLSVLAANQVAIASAVVFLVLAVPLERVLRGSGATAPRAPVGTRS